MLVLALAALVALIGLAAAQAASRLPNLREVAVAYGFQPRQVDEMLEGQTVFGKLRPVSDTELALSAGLLSRRNIAWHLAENIDFESESVRSDPTMMGHGVLSGDGALEDLAELTLVDEQLDRMGRVKAGTDMNFSDPEIRKLRAAGALADPQARRRAVLAAFKEVLIGRYQSYRDQGLSGLAPYKRSASKAILPAKQLKRAFGELRLTSQIAPTVHAAMAKWPAPLPEGVQSRFSWVVNGAEGRTLVALLHEIFGVENGHLVWISRRFYINHTLNTMQAVSATIPVGEGTVILYANRTSTDLVTGFGSSVAKKLGTFLMRREVGRLTEAFLEVSEAPDV